MTLIGYANLVEIVAVLLYSSESCTGVICKLQNCETVRHSHPDNKKHESLDDANEWSQYGQQRLGKKEKHMKNTANTDAAELRQTFSYV